MDFATFDPAAMAEEGAELNVLHPKTYEKTDIFIRIRGMDSPSYRAYAAEKKREAQLQPGHIPTPQEEEDSLIRSLAMMTIGWRGVEETKEGEEVATIIEFSREAAVKLYTKHAWLRDQLAIFVANRGNFLSAN